MIEATSWTFLPTETFSQTSALTQSKISLLTWLIFYLASITTSMCQYNLYSQTQIIRNNHRQVNNDQNVTRQNNAEKKKPYQKSKELRKGQTQEIRKENTYIYLDFKTNTSQSTCESDLLKYKEIMTGIKNRCVGALVNMINVMCCTGSRAYCRELAPGSATELDVTGSCGGLWRQSVFLSESCPIN